MFTKTSDFIAEWKTETAATQRLLDMLSDESLHQEILPGYRTLGQIAWHLAMSLSYMKDLGLNLNKPEYGEAAPDSADVIASEYRRISDELLRAVESQWSDEMLSHTVNIMGQDWNYGATLGFVLKHEAHHRGQMTVLMRQAGLKPSGVYGPTREEWIEQGKEPLL